MNQKTIVIMQPTYLPWAGYFNLMSEADVFVFLDDVQFEKQSWQQRNRVLVHGQPHWLTVPVRHESLSQLIRDIRIIAENPWRRKHASLIEQNYCRHPFFAELNAVLQLLNDDSLDRLAELNMAIIQRVAHQLALHPSLGCASQLGVSGSRSEKLLGICEHFGCEKYLSPVGSAEYLEKDGVFSKAKVRLCFQDFSPAPYPQHGTETFCSHLSILDVIANIGVEQTKSYIRSTPAGPGGQRQQP